MTAFPGAPRLLRAGIVVADQTTLAILRVIAMQYNPDSLSRTLQIRGATGEAGDRLDALRLTGPPVETSKLDAELDATDVMEAPPANSYVPTYGIQPDLAVLETLVHPPSTQIQADNTLAQAGTDERGPMEAPLTLFGWAAGAVRPVVRQ